MKIYYVGPISHAHTYLNGWQSLGIVCKACLMKK